jgi:hypothetical protein
LGATNCVQARAKGREGKGREGKGREGKGGAPNMAVRTLER